MQFVRSWIIHVPAADMGSALSGASAFVGCGAGPIRLDRSYTVPAYRLPQQSDNAKPNQERLGSCNDWRTCVTRRLRGNPHTDKPEYWFVGQLVEKDATEAVHTFTSPGQRTTKFNKVCY